MSTTGIQDISTGDLLALIAYLDTDNPPQALTSKLSSVEANKAVDYAIDELVRRIRQIAAQRPF